MARATSEKQGKQDEDGSWTALPIALASAAVLLGSGPATAGEVRPGQGFGVQAAREAIEELTGAQIPKIEEAPSSLLSAVESAGEAVRELYTSGAPGEGASPQVQAGSKGVEDFFKTGTEQAQQGAEEVKESAKRGFSFLGKSFTLGYEVPPGRGLGVQAAREAVEESTGIDLPDIDQGPAALKSAAEQAGQAVREVYTSGEGEGGAPQVQAGSKGVQDFFKTGAEKAKEPMEAAKEAIQRGFSMLPTSSTYAYDAPSGEAAKGETTPVNLPNPQEAGSAMKAAAEKAANPAREALKTGAQRAEEAGREVSAKVQSGGKGVQGIFKTGGEEAARASEKAAKSAKEGTQRGVSAGSRKMMTTLAYNVPPGRGWGVKALQTALKDTAGKTTHAAQQLPGGLPSPGEAPGALKTAADRTARTARETFKTGGQRAQELGERAQDLGGRAQELGGRVQQELGGAGRT